MSARDSSDLDTSAYIYWLASVEVHQLGLAYEVVDPTASLDGTSHTLKKYEADVEVLESSRNANDGGDILRLDQVKMMELGEKVRILVGKHRGKKARVIRLNKGDYQAELS
ncbi:LOW QUALITY PROTEIN: hypothetical protein ACHAXM_002142 [Skeletonema potamos]